MRQLKRKPHINPFFFNGLPREATVVGGMVDGYEFEGDPYPDGTAVLISRNFTCRPLAEIEAERQMRDKERQEIARRQDEISRLRKQEDRMFNESLNVPVRWRPEIKPVISGLSANSAGDGTNRRTVYHIYLLAPLIDGRLQRDPHTLLCGNGGSFHDLVMMDGQGNNNRVTCKACLKIAKRWGDNDQD